MRPHLLVLLAWVSACVTTGLSPNPDAGEDDPTKDGTVDPDRTARPETCNGVDDDLDGQIDEGYDDVDRDGVADCVDESCDVRTLPAGQTSLDERCVWVPPIVDDPWDLVVEWHWDADPSVVMPAVANLTDDNGDGQIDAQDTPDVVITAFNTGDVVALSGDGAGELWRAPGFRRDSGLAIGDVDADGLPDVVGVSIDNRVRALTHDGQDLWTSDDTFSFLYPVTTLADLQGDGIPEVIADTAIVSGLNGQTLARLDARRSGPWRAPVVSDLDGDGLKEILLATSVFDHTGREMWSLPIPPQTLSAFPALLQADDDPQAEIAWAVGSTLYWLNHDGSEIRRQPLSLRGRPGPPCVGDLDGDTHPDVVIPNSDRISAFDRHGALMWSTAINDSSGSAGCAVFDMNGDRQFEVIFADMDALMVLDGATGAIRYRNPAHGSVTYFETPVIADIDDDGSAEILTSSSGYSGYSGVTVHGHPEDGWPPAGPVWPVHDFDVENITPAGAIPKTMEPGWLKHGVFRGRPATDDSGLADLGVDLLDACVASCEVGGLLRLSIQVYNEGARPVPAGTPLVVFGIDGKVETELYATTLPELQPGERLPSHVVDLPWTDLPAGGLEVIVDPGGQVLECDEHDNTARLRATECGPG
ncbi:MAG: hypothetical protein AB8H79_20330 [Myxococcota bacterium]